MGKAPKAEIVAAGKHVKIDPEAKSTKAIRSLPPEHFDPITRRETVEKFYRDNLKDRVEDARREGKWHCEPFRREFIYWVWSWRAEWRARWAWHHRRYLDELLWAEWMADKAFAAEIAAMTRDNVAADPDYMPAELASTSPLMIYTDDYINAVYNPAPFLAVLSLKNLKSDASSDWIAAATSDSLLSNLSSVPGLFVADQQQVTQAVQTDKTLAANAVEPLQAARIGKAIEVERVVTGSYVVDGDKVLLNLRIVNVESGGVEHGISKTIARDHLLDEMPNLAASLASAMGYAPAGESATITTLSPVSTPPAVAGQPENGSRVVNLLSLVVPDRDVKKGKWRMENGELHASGGGAVIQFPYQPPAEYDFRIVFARVNGGDCVNQNCSANGRQFIWFLDAFGSHTSKFAQVTRKTDNDDPAGKITSAHTLLNNNQDYTSIVKVRKNSVAAYLDGELIAERKTDYSDMRAFPGWGLARSDVVGLGANGGTTFRTVEVIEITGTGKTLAEVPAKAPDGAK
jgi:TolB-like protein